MLVSAFWMLFVLARMVLIALLVSVVFGVGCFGDDDDDDDDDVGSGVGDDVGNDIGD